MILLTKKNIDNVWKLIPLKLTSLRNQFAENNYELKLIIYPM